MDWIFEGVGTLIIGLILGAGAGGAGGYYLGVHSVRQSQRAGKNATQTQIGGDQVTDRRRRPRS